MFLLFLKMPGLHNCQNRMTSEDRRDDSLTAEKSAITSYLLIWNCH